MSAPANPETEVKIALPLTTCKHLLETPGRRWT